MNDDEPSIPLTPGSFSVFISSQADAEVVRAVMSRQMAEVLERFNDEVWRKKADPEEDDGSEEAGG